MLVHDTHLNACHTCHKNLHVHTWMLAHVLTQMLVIHVIKICANVDEHFLYMWTAFLYMWVLQTHGLKETYYETKETHCEAKETYYMWELQTHGGFPWCISLCARERERVTSGKSRERPPRRPAGLTCKYPVRAEFVAELVPACDVTRLTHRRCVCLVYRP